MVLKHYTIMTNICIISIFGRHFYNLFEKFLISIENQYLKFKIYETNKIKETPLF